MKKKLIAAVSILSAAVLMAPFLWSFYWWNVSKAVQLGRWLDQ